MQNAKQLKYDDGGGVKKIKKMKTNHLEAKEKDTRFYQNLIWSEEYKRAWLYVSSWRLNRKEVVVPVVQR